MWSRADQRSGVPVASRSPASRSATNASSSRRAASRRRRRTVLNKAVSPRWAEETPRCRLAVRALLLGGGGRELIGHRHHLLTEIRPAGRAAILGSAPK